MATTMKLTDEVFRSFRVAKVFRENSDRINCINFSANGESMIASSNDDSISVYCCLEGKCALIRMLPSWSMIMVLTPVNAILGLREHYTARSMAVTCSSIPMLQIQ